VLDPWQEIILEAAMGERSDHLWAAKRVGVTVPRQNGKSQLLVSRALAGALMFKEKKIVISAHQADTARETFGKLLEILDADANDWLRSRLDPKFGRDGVMNAINREAVRFKLRDGSISLIQFKARTGAGGRGFSSDCLMLDEAQRLKRAAWVSINSTMSAMPNPQVWLLGTPPTRDDYDAGMGEVFESIRTAAIDGVSTAAAWAEWGADPRSDDYDPASDLTRWKANPAWNTRINHEIVQGEYESYTVEEFAQDRLGVWLDEIGNGGTREITAEEWRDTEGKASEGATPTYAVAFSVDGRRMSVAGHAGADGLGHVELVDEVYEGSLEGGLAPLADWFVQRNGAGVVRWRAAQAIVLSGAAGAGVLRQYLVDRGVNARRIIVASTPHYLQACEMFRQAIRERTVTHLASGQEVLDESVSVTDIDKRGGWIATTPDGDETPLEAVSLALWGARTTKPRRDPSERKAVFL
jgi:hypothetical protein